MNERGIFSFQRGSPCSFPGDHISPPHPPGALWGGPIKEGPNSLWSSKYKYWKPCVGTSPGLDATDRRAEP